MRALLLAAAACAHANAMRVAPARALPRRAALAVGLATFAAPARAACLPADVSTECIGVYKERALDITKQDATAAGIRWVERPAFRSAREAVSALRDASGIVAGWRTSCVDVGKSILAVRPRVDAACAVIAAAQDDATARLFTAAVDRALYSIDAADVAIGYELRETDARDAFGRAADADNALAQARADYATLLRFVDTLYSGGRS